jgi:hypothetical protein
LIAELSERTEEIRRFHAEPWPFQKTFKTPLEDLSRFVSVILGPFEPEKGTLSTDEVVFEPRRLLELMARNSITVENQWDLNLGAEGREDIADLLEAALGDWVDFVFLLSPGSIAIYADHDEYTTFYCLDQSVLANLGSELVQAGFESISNYIRGRVEDRLQ